MRDPEEGIGPDGAIVTGVDRGRVPPRFEPVLAAAVAALGDREDVSLYVYGSVATGRAREPTSDVDLVVIGSTPDHAARIGGELSARFADRCRAVALSTMPRDTLVAGGVGADGDEAYGNRVFLRHHCAHVAGPDPVSGLPPFAADARAARGFNGDIGGHAERWRTALRAGESSIEDREDRSVEHWSADDRSAGSTAALARRIARKTLFAVAGLVSVHDGTWTTDRASSAARWAEVDPPVATGLRTLVGWSDGDPSDRGDGAPTVARLQRALDTTVAHVVGRFDAEIGLWRR